MVAGHEQHLEEEGGRAEDLPLVPSEPLVLERNRMHNLLKEKSRELETAQSEVKALRATEALNDKAVEELRIEVEKFDEKHRVTRNVLEQKNLEMKKLAEEKRDALSAQYAAEATLLRVHTNQKDVNEPPPLESFIGPLESEIKMLKNEISVLQEDKKALERLTKSKELALLEAEKILRSALERVLIVEEVQNQNYELRRQIEICQEENRILEKTNRQKVLEVGKLSQTIQELEEAVLAGGAAANTIRDYKRQIEELNEEKRTLERELARVKVSANRVATVIANEWKDDGDKVMPVKQWLEERRLMQAEMQRMREKLAISDRTAKAEAQLKEKLKLRLKTLEEGLKHVTSFPTSPNPFFRSPKTDKSSNFLGFLTNPGGLGKRSTSQPRASIVRTSPLQHPNIVDNETANTTGELKRSDSLRRKKSLWATRTKVVDSSGKENTEVKVNSPDNSRNDDKLVPAQIKTIDGTNEEDATKCEGEDVVSGFLYDRLQKEVISLRKHCEVKESNVNAKDQEIKMLMRKVDALTKSMEVESKKVKREAVARDKEAAATAKVDEHKKNRAISSSNRVAKAY